MSEISDKIKAASDAIGALEDKLATLGGDLTQEIKEINDKLSSAGGSGVTAEDLASLQTIADRLTAVSTSVGTLDDTVKNIVTP